jgi:opacity protein-like surface antigen
MKKTLAICSILLASTSLATAADNYSNPSMMDNNPNMLENWDMTNFYVGGDLGYATLDYSASVADSADASLPMLNVYLGYELGNFKSIDYALEVGGFITKNTDRTNGGVSTDSQESGIYADLVGKYALPYNFSAIGSAGIQYSKLSVENTTTNINENEFAPRLGAGLEYAINDDLAVRGMVRYAFTDYNDTVQNTAQYTIGMNYKF